jgi:hypothetical protein
MASYTPNTSSEDSDRSLKHAEDAARAEIASLVGRPLSDQEWKRMSGRLVEFVRILRYWKQARTTEESGVAGTSVLDRVA